MDLTEIGYKKKQVENRTKSVISWAPGDSFETDWKKCQLVFQDFKFRMIKQPVRFHGSLMSLVSTGVWFFQNKGLAILRINARVFWGAIFSWVQKCREPVRALDRQIGRIGVEMTSNIKQKRSVRGGSFQSMVSNPIYKP